LGLLWGAIGAAAFYHSLPPERRPFWAHQWLACLIIGAALGPIALTSRRIWRR
jgi:hypothetical protein